MWTNIPGGSGHRFRPRCVGGANVAQGWAYPSRGCALSAAWKFFERVYICEINIVQLPARYRRWGFEAMKTDRVACDRWTTDSPVPASPVTGARISTPRREPKVIVKIPDAATRYPQDQGISECKNKKKDEWTNAPPRARISNRTNYLSRARSNPPWKRYQDPRKAVSTGYINAGE